MAHAHRRIALAERAQARTQRRALLLLASCDAEQDPSPAVVSRLDRLIGEADALWERLSGMPEAEAQLRQAWRVAA